MSLAYRSGTHKLAIQVSRGSWVVYDLRGYDPMRHLWREWKPDHIVGTRTNRRDAIALART